MDNQDERAPVQLPAVNNTPTFNPASSLIDTRSQSKILEGNPVRLMRSSNHTKRRVGSSVRVFYHPVEITKEANLDEMTRQGLQSLADRMVRGCWFLCPRYTVFSPSPTAEFFRRVIDLQLAWIFTCCAALGIKGQRQRSRQFQKMGRRDGYFDLDSIVARGIQPDPDLHSVPFSNLTDAERKEVIQRGVLAKQAAFSGLVFIDGEFTPAPEWQAMANGLLHPGDVPPFDTTRLQVDLSPLKATGDHAYLKAASLAELRSHLAANPNSALYCCPGITVVAPSSNPAFLAEALKRSKEWHGKLSHALGKDRKPLIKEADLTTKLLVWDGTLVVEGQCYLPGCWPDAGQKEQDQKRTPMKSSTVPLSFLGLNT